MTQDVLRDFYTKTDFQLEACLLAEIRQVLVSGCKLSIPESLVLPFQPVISQVYVTLFQRGLKPLRWGAKQATLAKTLARVLEKLTQTPRFHEFTIADNQQCRILFEIVVDEKPCEIRNMTGLAFSQHRFEPGITGLKTVYEGITRYFMPTDAVVHSIMSVPQVLQFLAKKTGIAKKTNKFSEREQLMRQAPIDYTFIQSIAFISYAERALPLYRGYPVPVEFNKHLMLDSTLKSIDWLIDNMNADGSFLYYYDGYLDSKVDFDHPKMVDPLYNNILRHSGGTITLLRGYELTADQRYLAAADHSLQFLFSTLREHEYQGQYACYPFDNKKSKLGGAGIGLVALMHHYRHIQDERYRSIIDGLVRHILSRIDTDGEMIGYYIHPIFNQGEPLLAPPDDVKQQLFSFYYPGEALLGLALYYRWIKNIDADLQAEIHTKSLMALDFLVDVRPIKYHALFLPLPADAWLMQAIEEWAKVDDFRKQSYIDFVFNDARAMIEHAYQEHDSPYFDYVGGFYYHYGDHVYHDASRCEGLVAAYYLAQYLGDTAQADYIMTHMQKAAKGLMHTRHTPESTYAHLYPEKSINSFRFKLTRQWVRVDSVQHAACFFARLWFVLADNGTKLASKTSLAADTESDNAALPEYIGDYSIIKLIERSGFSSVYLVEKDGIQYALKRLKQSSHINRVTNEINILNIMQALDKHVLKFHFAKRYQQDIYLFYDYAPQGNLKKYIQNNGLFSIAEALNFVDQFLGILDFTQKNGILHLDIKPANVLLHNNYYCLADWGLAMQKKEVKTVQVKGNPMYLAPETFLGMREFPSEIYALGCCLYYCVVGKHLFSHQNTTSLYKKIYTHIYVTPKIPKLLPNKLRLLLVRMLQKNPRQRATLAELRFILSRDEAGITEDELLIQKSVKKPDFSNPIALYQSMAEDGVAWMQYELGKLYDLGNRVAIDKPQAFYWFQKAASQGLAAGQFCLGLAYRNGMGHAIDFKAAKSWLTLAAEQEHGEAQYHLAVMLEEGLGCEPNIPLALEWYRKAAKNGCKLAYTALSGFNETVVLAI